MNALDFEYAIRKDVRNNPIVREVDRARIREMLVWAAVGVVLVGLVLFWSLQHFKAVDYGYEIEVLRQQRAQEESINRRLKVEIASLRAPQRIASVATRDLKLVPPARDTTLVVERVTTSPPPARALVASR
jgi:cell division protein FtsL